MSVLVVGVVVLALTMAGSLVAFRRLRSWAQAVERSPQDVADRAHRLRVGQAKSTLGGIALGLALLIVSDAELARAHRHHSGATVATGWALVSLAAVVSYVAALLFGYKAIRPSYVRTRDIATKVPFRKRQAGIGVVFGAAFIAVYAVGVALAPKHGTAHVLGIALAYVVALVLCQSLLAPLWLVALNAKPLNAATHRRLMALDHQLGGHVRDIKAFPARSQRTANAVQVGLIPGLRYILVSDYLLDNMNDVEVDAVVAHELGHARGNHLAIKLLAVAGCWTAVLIGSAAVAGTSRSGATGVVVAAIPLGYLVALVLVQGIVGIRLERRADAVAARDVGAQPLADALDKLADLNHTRRRTGHLWNILTQHPGIDDRIRALRQTPPAHAHRSPVTAHH